MTVTAENWLEGLVDEIRPALYGGAVSGYLPEFEAARVDDLAIAIDYGADGILTAGQCHSLFTAQSVVKVFTLLLALHHRGEDYVFERVGCDQGIGSYNSLETFIRGSGVPVNPFVNAGALVVVDMLPGSDPDSRVRNVVDFIRALSGNTSIGVNTGVARSEHTLADRNRALGYFLRSHRLISTDVEELLWAYCQMCAIEVDVVDLARAARVLAQARDVVVEGQVLRAAHLRLVRRLMLFAGMYEASGQYACDVGIPAKCGVSGATIGVVYQRMGIGVYGPALDRSGNSVGGLRVLRQLSGTLDFD
ncbi:glutaminase A [Mycolicibacterium flavescens]|uniref:Glutaminase n=1 Tax=Mycolicibacterium flavescens TaxID=1776 RepID=A0A1E3RI86_MYCFV|nr:glutaminase A [Mycolicibacterium flavescens]MCV7282163.1 glutaminase A [Mycolicibacterium flavescens]ODQ89574.1 glutaminase A [Mycolicibacterium flavescens]